MGGLGFESRQGKEDFLLSKTFQTGCGAQSTSCLVGTVVLYQR
jgi:hypothetical protein